MKSLTLALTLSLLGTTAAFAMPALKGDITVNTDIVTVGDMFDNAGELSETAIFRAPAPGTTGIVPLADVQAAAKLIGLADFDNVGFTRVVVARASTTVDAALLDKLIAANLAQRGMLAAGVTPETHFDLANIDINAQQSDVPASLVDLRYAPDTGLFTARFQIAGYDQPMDLGGSIELMTSAPRLIATEPAGTVLSAADFEMASIPLSTAQAGGYATADQLIGKQLIRQAHTGLMLKPSDVTDPTVVSRNSLVTVILHSGEMTLTVKGQALTTAAAGEPVDVLNSVTKKILHGVARSDGSVEIVTATTPTTVAAL